MRYKLIVWASLGFLFLFQSRLLQAEVVELTLKKTERLALAHNPMVLATQAVAAGAQAAPLAIWAPFDPMLMAGWSGQSASPLALSDAGMRTLMWDQRWRFPGKSLIDLGGVHAGVRFKEALARDAKREALLQARMAYWHLYEEQEIYAIRKDAEKQWRRFRELLVSRGLAGQWISLKLIKAQLGLARDSNDFITAREKISVAKSHLRHILGQAAGTDFTLGPPAALKPFDDAAQSHLHQQHTDHPRVSAAVEALTQARARRAAARAAFLPDLNTRLWRDDRVMGADGYGFRVGVQVPLGLGQGAALSAADGEVEAAEQMFKAAQDLVHHLLEDARVSAQSAWNLVALYEEGGLIAQTNQAWTFAQQAWRNESLPLADYIESYDSYLDIRSAYIRAKAGYGKTLARVDFEKGVFELKE